MFTDGGTSTGLSIRVASLFDDGTLQTDNIRLGESGDIDDTRAFRCVLSVPDRMAGAHTLTAGTAEPPRKRNADDALIFPDPNSNRYGGNGELIASATTEGPTVTVTGRARLTLADRARKRYYQLSYQSRSVGARQRVNHACRDPAEVWRRAADVLKTPAIWLEHAGYTVLLPALLPGSRVSTARGLVAGDPTGWSPLCMLAGNRMRCRFHGRVKLRVLCPGISRP